MQLRDVHRAHTGSRSRCSSVPREASPFSFRDVQIWQYPDTCCQDLSGLCHPPSSGTEFKQKTRHYKLGMSDRRCAWCLCFAQTPNSSPWDWKPLSLPAPTPRRPVPGSRRLVGKRSRKLLHVAEQTAPWLHTGVRNADKHPGLP